MADIPILKSERLILRCPTIEDWPQYSKLMMSDRSVYMGGPYSLEQAWGWFCHDIAQWRLFGHGGLMIVSRQTGKCIGQVGINSGPLFPEHELGWLLYPQAEGAGYALEAATTFKAWAFEALNLQSLVSYVSPSNVRSRALAERLGATLDVDAPRPDPDDLVYRHNRL